MSAFEICGMCGRQYDTAAAAHSCDHTPAKPSYPFEVFPWDDDVTNDNGWVGAKDAIAAYDALLAENEKLNKALAESYSIEANLSVCLERDELFARAEKNYKAAYNMALAISNYRKQIERLEAEIESLHQAAAHNGKGAYDKINSLEAKIESLKGIAKIMDIAKATIGIDPAQVAAEINENKQLNERLEKERAVNKVLVECLERIYTGVPCDVFSVARESLAKAEELRK
jgi:NADPH-dependent 7-cyano-7-deazaguanine reductase QueF